MFHAVARYTADAHTLGSHAGFILCMHGALVLGDIQRGVG